MTVDTIKLIRAKNVLVDATNDDAICVVATQGRL
jgi:hypothetical protein